MYVECNKVISRCFYFRVQSIERALERLASYNESVTVEHAWVSAMQNKLAYLPPLSDGNDAAQPTIETTLVSEYYVLEMVFKHLSTPAPPSCHHWIWHSQ